MLSRAALVVLLLIPSASAFAVSPTVMRAIVLTGTKLPERVGSKLEATRAKLTNFVFADGFPKVMDSGSIAGMNPGFEIVVLGFCPAGSAAASSVAELVEKEAKRAVPGAYGKEVRGTLAAACPRLKIPKPDEPDGIKVWSAWEKAPDSSETQVALGNYLVSIGDLDGGEYLGYRAIAQEPNHAGAKSLLEKIGLLRAD